MVQRTICKHCSSYLTYVSSRGTVHLCWHINDHWRKIPQHLKGLQQIAFIRLKISLWILFRWSIWFRYRRNVQLYLQSTSNARLHSQVRCCHRLTFFLCWLYNIRKKLKTIVKTKWNSTYLMFKSCVVIQNNNKPIC